jgi:hypothetical protein
MPVEEMTGLVRHCEFFDLTVSWIEGEQMPPWRCPQCGGTDYIWMHEP